MTVKRRKNIFLGEILFLAQLKKKAGDNFCNYTSCCEKLKTIKLISDEKIAVKKVRRRRIFFHRLHKDKEKKSFFSQLLQILCRVRFFGQKVKIFSFMKRKKERKFYAMWREGGL